jgi:hypothetical protein
MAPHVSPMQRPSGVIPLGMAICVASSASPGTLWAMARRPVTIEVDEKLLDAARAVAQRTGVPTEELYERALREVLVRDFDELTQEIAAGQARGVTLSEDEGLKLAYEELRSARAERRNAS